MKIYLAHPINGLSYAEVVTYYEVLARQLTTFGYQVLQPMTAKGYLRNEIKFRQEGYLNPCSTNHAIYERDQWMVRQADVVLVDLEHTVGPSIGCLMELAWASLLGKHTVLILPQNSLFRHAFVLEAADVIFTTLDQAIDYLLYLATGEQGEYSKTEEEKTDD